MRFFTHQPLRLSVDVSISSAQMIDMCALDHADPEVGNEFGFNGSEGAIMHVETRLVCLEGDFTPNESLESISKAGFAPCDFRHLLSFGSQFKSVYQELEVLVLCVCGFTGFPMLSGKKSRRSLLFHRVPCVRKEQYLLVKSPTLIQ